MSQSKSVRPYYYRLIQILKPHVSAKDHHWHQMHTVCFIISICMRPSIQQDICFCSEIGTL